MKKNKFRVNLSIVGIIIGVFIGFGFLNQTKKSQRDTIFIYAMCGGISVGLIGGYRLGYKFDMDVYKEELLGLDKTETEYHKNGKSWLISTKWTDSKNNKHILLTGQTSEKVLVSQLNDKLLMNHELLSGSKVNVEKHHKIAKSYLFKKLKDEIQVDWMAIKENPRKLTP